MITKKEIDEMIDCISKDPKSYVGETKTLGLRKTYQNRIRFYKDCKLYLETDPNEESLNKWLNWATETVKSISERYGQWMANNPSMMLEKSSKQKFESETGIKDLKKRIKTVNFIINGK